MTSKKKAPIPSRSGGPAPFGQGSGLARKKIAQALGKKKR
jgi:hypothetical protein